MGWHCRHPLPKPFSIYKSHTAPTPQKWSAGAPGVRLGLPSPSTSEGCAPSLWVAPVTPTLCPHFLRTRDLVIQKTMAKVGLQLGSPPTPHPPTCTLPSGADIWGHKSSIRKTVAYLSEKGARKAGGEQTRERHSLCSDRPLRECHLLPASPATACQDTPCKIGALLPAV